MIINYKDPATGKWVKQSISGSSGAPGKDGRDGSSAYEIAKLHGFSGTEDQWLTSLEGKSAYEIAVEYGFGGSAEDWLAYLKGHDGTDGKSAYQYATAGGYTGTEAEFAIKLAQATPTTLPNPHAITINGTSYDGSQPVEITVEGVAEESKTETVLSGNLFDRATAIRGKVFYYSITGMVLAEDDWSYYQYVPLRGAGIYRTKWNNAQHNSTGSRIAITTEDNTWLQSITGTLTATDNNYAYDMTFTVTQEMINNGAAKIAFDCHPTLLDTVMIVKDRDYPDEYIPYGYIEVATPNARKQDNVLCEKTAVFLGDSLCAGTTVSGDYYNYGWAGLIGEPNMMNWFNYGMNGGTVTSLETVQTIRWLHTQAEQAITEHPAADYVMVEGGCNDADQMQAAGLGEISADYSTFDTSSFSGALESLFLKLVTAYPMAKIGYIIPQKMYSGKVDYTAANHVHRLYFDRAIAICEKWGIPYIDLWNRAPLNPKLATASIYYTDGQHLTLAGYQRITPQIEAFMRSL